MAKFLKRGLTHSKLPGSPDFVFTRAKLAVFVHGCWWHRCPNENYPLPRTHAAFWRRKFERNVERDKLNAEELEALGWQVLVVWEHEVRENPAAAASKVRKLAAELLSRRSREQGRGP